MKGKQTYFFATKIDLELIIKLNETQRDLKYVKSGLFNTPDPVVYDSFIKYEDLGKNFRGQSTNGDIMFLVFDRATKIVVRPVPQVSQGIKYAIDQKLNQNSVNLTPSGFYDQNTLIIGKISTLLNDSNSLEIYNLFRKNIIKNSSQVGYVRVCTEAMKFMKGGGRMVTMGIDSPLEYDLRVE